MQGIKTLLGLFLLSLLIVAGTSCSSSSSSNDGKSIPSSDSAYGLDYN